MKKLNLVEYKNKQYQSISDHDAIKKSIRSFYKCKKRSTVFVEARIIINGENFR